MNPIYLTLTSFALMISLIPSAFGAFNDIALASAIPLTNVLETQITVNP